ncbi:dUTP diphosphatase [Roseinatronobacter alkalisoli]|uniref:Deoxyuridine 5'-triphosphate nucleotidohydrolase n=1 Tax=Roseinatronobacter alkalisoli TaxID=3028235 RepID=A0ABT5T656_9RHOB|nr:dUTP diphosphatase [Roseinatronobacter sp. HJB301]MDD7970582.1 dUTP diphosphatase [Roseinatronobacter sp. HJB301]
MTIPLTFQRLPDSDPDIALPVYATDGAAGADIRANFPPDQRAQGLTLAPMERALVPTGLACAVPRGYEMQIRARSGLALKHGIALVNAPGTIDSDYRGPIGVIVINLGTTDFTVDHGMRIAQIILAPVTQAQIALNDQLDGTDRGTGGFGSTGTG